MPPSTLSICTWTFSLPQTETSYPIKQSLPRAWHPLIRFLTLRICLFWTEPMFVNKVLMANDHTHSSAYPPGSFPYHRSQIYRLLIDPFWIWCWPTFTLSAEWGAPSEYIHLNAEFQRIARRDKKAFLSDQCKEKRTTEWERLEISSRKLEGGGRGVQGWELMYTYGGFMSMYGKTNTVL